MLYDRLLSVEVTFPQAGGGAQGVRRGREELARKGQMVRDTGDAALLWGTRSAACGHGREEVAAGEVA